MMRWREESSKSGIGNVYHVNVEPKRNRDSNRPPTVFCHVMNIEDEINPNCTPVGSASWKFALLEMTSGPKRSTG